MNELKEMDYWELRKLIAKLIPRSSRFDTGNVYRLKEKGRKSNYYEFNLVKRENVKIERLLDKENIKSFAEVSLRAQSCPMPLNIDVWDGMRCPFRCRYCYADYFKHSLYTSFFDNSKYLGLRYSDPKFYISKLDKILKHRGEKTDIESKALLNAIRLEIPMRLGIRFEDFIYAERKKGISLQLLKYLRDVEYPTMVNTKSDLIGEEEYVRVLSDNGAGSAVHMTLISADPEFIRKVEPGAPSFEKR